MKKIIALLLVFVLAFSAVSIVCSAADGKQKDVRQEIQEALSGGEEDTEETYTVLNFFRDLFSRLNILIEYFITVFFPDLNKV